MDKKFLSQTAMFNFAVIVSWLVSLGARMSASLAYGGIVYIPEPVTEPVLAETAD